MKGLQLHGLLLSTPTNQYMLVVKFNNEADMIGLIKILKNAPRVVEPGLKVFYTTTAPLLFVKW